MSSPENILLIVEGEKLEPLVMERLAQTYHVPCRIASVAANIHSLYRKLKQEEGFCDVIPVLQEILQEHIKKYSGEPKLCGTQKKQMEKWKKDLETLKGHFASVYLIFDSELQDRDKQENRTSVPKDIVRENCGELRDMLEYFSNETEQGKLYINYPMMESFRDCDDFFDEKYKDRAVSIDDLFGLGSCKGYKMLVGQRKLANIRPEKLSRDNFNRLILMNVFKLNYVVSQNWNTMSYDDFCTKSEQSSIFRSICSEIEQHCRIPVLNTSLFFAADYFSRENNPFEEIMKSK